MRILLLRPPYATLIRPFSPYGMMTVASILKSLSGVEVKVVDTNSVHKTFSNAQILDLIEEYSPSLLGLNINIMNAWNTYKLIEILKDRFPDIPLIVGGIHTYDAIDEIMRESKPDIIVKGEADISLKTLVQNIINDGKQNSIRSIGMKVAGLKVLQEDGTFLDTGPTPLLDDLDRIPYVDPRNLNLEDFIKSEADHNFITNIVVFQRGCPYSCSFCKADFLAGKIRHNSPKYAVEQVERLHNDIGYEHIFIADNNFTLSKNWTIEFCEEVIRKGLNRKVSFEIQTNIRTRLDDEILSKMKEANITRIELGIERLTEEGWAIGEKSIDYEDMIEKLDRMKKYDFEILTNILLGYPQDTLEIINKEFRMFYNIRHYFGAIGVKIFIPTPGTELYDNNPNPDRSEEWYLKPSFTKMSTSFFQATISDFSGAYFNNPNGISRSILHRILWIQTFFVSYTIFRTNYFLIIPRFFEILLSFLSLLLYRIHPKIEATLFKPFIGACL